MMVSNNNLNFNEISKLIDDIRAFLFPNYFDHVKLKKLKKSIIKRSKKQIERAFSLSKNTADIKTLLDKLLKNEEELIPLLEGDISAFLQSDPAAHDENEIIMIYPGFFAIFVYRLAHLFYELNIPYIPRMMSEYAHQVTGIDIHPGAQIGTNFFIDHGTGVVIGQTAIIGNFVKIYQGVTLGALSLNKGNKLKGEKRHPTIKDYVTIYSNATILGGNTIIGSHVTVAANTLIVQSVPDNSIAKSHRIISDLEIIKKS